MYIEKDTFVGGCEPVAARVVRTAQLARQCIDQLQSDHVRAHAEAALTLLLDDPSRKFAWLLQMCFRPACIRLCIS